MKWKILDVVYNRSYNKWLVKYEPANGGDARLSSRKTTLTPKEGDGVESSMLSEVLDDAKKNNDVWYKPEYDVMLVKNTAMADSVIDKPDEVRRSSRLVKK